MLKVIKKFTYHESLIEYIEKIIAHRYIVKKNKKYVLNKKQRMAVYANDEIGAAIYINGIYEKNYLDALIYLSQELKITNNENCAIDIGANIGNHSIYFSDFFKQVISYEANPYTYKLLEFNTDFISNIEVNNFGLGDKSEQLRLYEDTSNYGASSIIYHNEGQHYIDVDIKCLDDVLEQNVEIGLIKIDVEGMEYNVLLGATKIIEAQQPLIVLEQGKTDFLPNKNETLSIKFLKECGYTFCWIEEEKKELPKLLRFFYKFYKFIDRKTIVTKIVQDECIPFKHHSMLIGIPPTLSKDFNNIKGEK